MTRATILLLSNSGDFEGGGEHSLHDLVLGLAASRFHLLVVCPARGALATRLAARGVPVTAIPFPAWGSGRLFAIARALGRLATFVSRHRIALIHCNATWRIALYAGLVGRWTGTPVLWHVRVKEREGWKDRLLARLASAIVVNSDAVARRFVGVPAGKVERIHNGIDLARFTPQRPSAVFRSELGLPPGVPVVGSVGRFVAYKGYTHLLHAAAAVREKQSAVHWVLVGDGELRQELEALRARLDLEATVHFVGWRDDVSACLALFDVFVLPSLGEHFGRVIVEAMAMEKPVVATGAGGVPEIVGHGITGLLVPPADPVALAAAILSLLEDPVRAVRLGAAGRRRAVSDFSLSGHVAAIERLYARMLGETGHHV